MTAPIVFLDTETTSLSADTGEVWEFAGIRREGDGEEKRLWIQIECDLGTADPMSLKIGKYYERFGTHGHGYQRVSISTDGGETWSPDSVPDNGSVVDKFEAASLISEFTRGAHIVGNCVSFDAERLERLLRGYLQCPGWHYHIIDIEPMIIGYALRMGEKFPLPYSSKDLTEWLGVPEPDESVRHTAMGDALWVRDQWDALHHAL